MTPSIQSLRDRAEQLDRWAEQDRESVADLCGLRLWDLARKIEARAEDHEDKALAHRIAASVMEAGAEARRGLYSTIAGIQGVSK
jgi:hypothetical protein